MYYVFMFKNRKDNMKHRLIDIYFRRRDIIVLVFIMVFIAFFKICGNKFVYFSYEK